MLLLTVVYSVLYLLGYQSYQIDKSVQGVIDEACLKGISSLNDVLCIPAFVFQYSPVENITFSMKEHNSDTLITQLNALTLDGKEYQLILIKSFLNHFRRLLFY